MMKGNVIRIHSRRRAKQFGRGGGGTMNIPECSNQNIFKCTKLYPFFLIGLRWSLKKRSSPKLSARIISPLQEQFQICPNLFPRPPRLLRLCQDIYTNYSVVQYFSIIGFNPIFEYFWNIGITHVELFVFV